MAGSQDSCSAAGGRPVFADAGVTPPAQAGNL